MIFFIQKVCINEKTNKFAAENHVKALVKYTINTKAGIYLKSMAVEEKVKLLMIDDDEQWVKSIINAVDDHQGLTIYQSKSEAASIKEAIAGFQPSLVMIDILNFGAQQAEILAGFREEKGFIFKLVLFADSKTDSLLYPGECECCDNIISKESIAVTIQQCIAADRKNKEKRKEDNDKSGFKAPNKFIALQTVIGLRFVNKKNIVYFEYGKDEKSGKSQWEAFLNNAEIIKLKINTSSKDILRHFEAYDFIQISQSNIINMDYFSSVELKSRKCILEKPFDNKEMIISRAYFNEIKSKYELN